LGFAIHSQARQGRRPNRVHLGRWPVLRTGRSPPVAPHLASQRRGYLRLRGSDQTSARTCTLLTLS